MSKKTHRYSYKDIEELPPKRAAVLRYGAIGDAILASSILPHLKDEGFHITFYCNPQTHEVLKHDPHIDDFYIQDTDQVENRLLPQFWGHEKKKYQRFINLSETIEGTLLALPGRPNHHWPMNLRRRMCATVNYTEFTHGIAEVPLPPRPGFYATEEEKAWARKERAKIGGEKLILYSLSGSSVHKTWPWQDQLFARILLTRPDYRILTVGDELCQILESGWESEPRVIRKAGKYCIRETLSLIPESDIVIGSETGILNAAGHQEVPKILFLSHSSQENLTKYWQNTIALEPQNTPCYPCNMMHYTFDHCHKHEEIGVSMCAVDIGLEQAWSAFEKLLT